MNQDSKIKRENLPLFLSKASAMFPLKKYYAGAFLCLSFIETIENKNAIRHFITKKAIKSIGFIKIVLWRKPIGIGLRENSQP